METKRIIPAALLAAALLIGTACEPDDEPTDGVVTADNPAGLDTRDEVYLSTVREGAPSFASINDATLIEFGESVCTGLDNGRSWTDLLRMGLDSGLNNIDLGFTMGAGIGTYCPEHTDEISLG